MNDSTQNVKLVYDEDDISYELCGTDHCKREIESLLDKLIGKVLLPRAIEYVLYEAMEYGYKVGHRRGWEDYEREYQTNLMCQCGTLE